ncbi:MAG: septal ring lytic transglycosylase RlpA family protein [Wenzhouxiangellaceae bacterium]
MSRWFAALALVTALLVTACAVREARDGPGRPLDPNAIEEPKPRPEPRARYGNHSPYTVAGRTYHVLPSARGYRERGLASWYGAKFHGRRTSSGEAFDMYKVSGAHRTLPLPTWVEVTNLDNGRRLYVRINDRGPFNEDRIIDLSYAAAVRLGMVEAGTARVEVRAIDLEHLDAGIEAPARVPVRLQIGAFAERERAEQLAARLRALDIQRVDVDGVRRNGRRLWRVRIGPIHDLKAAHRLAERLLAEGLGRPIYVY